MTASRAAPRGRLVAAGALGLLLTFSAALPSPPPPPLRHPDRSPAAGSHSAHHPGRLLVRFRASVPGVAKERARRDVQGTLLHTYAWVDGLELLGVPEGEVGNAVAALERNPSVLYAEPDLVVRAWAVPDDPRFAELWGLRNTGQAVAGGSAGTPGADANVTPAWDLWTGSADFRVAVIDTGVNYLHPDLAPNIWTNPGEIAGNGLDDDGNGYVDDVHGYDFVNDDPDPLDDHFHGSHVSGTICASGNNGLGIAGVNWRCQIVAVKFLDAFGTGQLSDAVRAIEYVIANRIPLSNNSWGGAGFSQALDDAIAASRAVGHLFVAAAGNSSDSIDLRPVSPASSPQPNAVAVAATDQNDALAPFSNFGELSVDLGAPGTNVLSTVLASEYEFKQGTSMACPHVVGAAALVWSRYPLLTWEQVKSRLLDSAVPLPSLEGRTATGGRLDVLAALADCNGNGVLDDSDIAAGSSTDCSGNGIPDECEPDCNGSGQADSCDLHAGTSLDCDADSVPDECESDCDASGTPDDCDLQSGVALDCNRNAVPDFCDVTFGGLDCNGNGQPDPCDVESGSSLDCNANGIPDECVAIEPDCNGNGTPDTCDVDGGGSLDCDGDLVPDECQTLPDCNGNGVADALDVCYGTEPDCNANDVPDGCEIAAGTSADCNGNSRPDECDFGLRVGLGRKANFDVFDISDGFVATIAQAGHTIVDDASVDPSGIDVLVQSGAAVGSTALLDDFVLAGGSLVFLATDNPLPAAASLPVAARTGPWRMREGAHLADPESASVRGLPAATSLSGLAHDLQLKAGAQTVIAWNDGTPLLIVSRHGAGRAAYLNDAGAWLGSMSWQGDPAFGALLMPGLLAFLDDGFQDCDGSFSLDSCDIALGTATDVFPPGGDGVPDSCQTDCDGNGVPDRQELSGRDCNANGTLDTCAPLEVDCDGNGTPDPCEVIGGGSDCNGNGLHDACEPDCDGSGLPDRCDITAGAASDCDADGVPDSCEPDGDLDGRPDDCEGLPAVLMSGGANDLTVNAVADRSWTLTRVGRFNFPADLSPYDAVVLVDQGVPTSPATQSAIDAFVAAGGGLLLFQNDVRLMPTFTGESNPVLSAGTPQPTYFDGTVTVRGDSPLFQGLPARSKLIGRAAPALFRDAAQEAARWSLRGWPAVLTMGYGGGRSASINHREATESTEPWSGDADYGVQVVHNALDWLAGSSGPCVVPGLPATVAGAARDPGTGTTRFTFEDSNPVGVATSYNVYRSSDPTLASSAWLQVGPGILDGDPLLEGIQWADPGGDPAPGEAWFFAVSAFNAHCPAEGPR